MNVAKYRIGQGMRALLADAMPVDSQSAQRNLSAQEFAAFRSMSRDEQLHSLLVLQEVFNQQRNTPRELAVAALLHDVGKSRYHLALWQKTLSVVIKAVIPPLAEKLGKGESSSFCRLPFSLRRNHAKWGAEILRSCDSDAVVVWLVEHHQDRLEYWRDHPNIALLQRLQLADDAC